MIVVILKSVFLIKPIIIGKFKSLDVSGSKEGKNDDAFELQLKASIAEATKAKVASRKVFGGKKVSD